MAGLKIIWSEEAVQCFHQILRFIVSKREIRLMCVNYFKCYQAHYGWYLLILICIGRHQLLIPVFLYANILEFIIVFIQIIF